MILVHFHQRMRLDVGGWQDLISWFVYIFVEQKSWGTFAFLFGVGFAILLRRLDARGAPVVAIYLRRLVALAVFGIIAEVGFGFSILFSYACWGVGLLVVRRWSNRVLVATAIVSAMARPTVAAVIAIVHWMHGTAAAPNPFAALGQAAEAAAEHGSYAALLAAPWAEFTAPPTWRVLLPDTNFVLFIIGLLAVRHGVFDEPLKHVRAIRGWMIFGALSWALWWTVMQNLPHASIPGLQWAIVTAFGLIEDQWLCFFYIGMVVLLLAKRPQWTLRLAPIGQAGRMALSNYMLQAVVLDAMASGYGWALKIPPARYVIYAPIFFGVVAALSTMWLSKFRFGPLEWIWRSVTYWRLQPMTRTTEERAPALI